MKFQAKEIIVGVTLSLLLKTKTSPSSRFLIEISILLHFNITNCVVEISNNDVGKKIFQARLVNQ